MRHNWNADRKLSLPAIELERAVIDSLRAYERDEEVLAYAEEMQKGMVSRLDVLRSQIVRSGKDLTELGDQERELAEQLKGVAGGSARVLEWLDRRLEEIERQRQETQQRLHELEREEQLLGERAVDVRTLRSSLKVMFDRFQASDLPTQRGLMRQIFKRIRVFKDNKVGLTWSIPMNKPQCHRGEHWGLASGMKSGPTIRQKTFTSSRPAC